MTTQPLKKRTFGESLAIVEEGEDPIPPSSTASSSQTLLLSRTTTRTFGVPALPPFILEQQIESLKIELDHERSLRSLDHQRAQHAQERLEKRVQIAVDEAKEATKALMDFRLQSDKMTEQLRQSRNQALAELRQREIERLENANHSESEDIEAAYDDYDDDNKSDVDQEEEDKPRRVSDRRGHRRRCHASSMSNVWKEKCLHLEKLLEAQRIKEKDLQARFASLRSDLDAHKREQQQQQSRDIHDSELSAAVAAAVEEAPPAVMKELNRVRISLADSERRERQLNRKVEELQRRNQSLVRDREEAKLDQQRLPVVQEQLEQIRKEHEVLAAQQEAWNEFVTCLDTIIHNSNTINNSNESSVPSNSSFTTAKNSQQQNPPCFGTGMIQSKKVKVPPELSVVHRFLDDAKSRVLDLEKQNASLQHENKELKTTNLPLETKIQQLADAEEAAKRETRDVERKLKTCQRQVAQLESQQAIHRREIDNLQALIKTLDDLPLPTSSTQARNHSLETMEIVLSSTKEELQIVQIEKDRLSKESEATRIELEGVKEKFGKLRDALHVERAKVEQAEQRAHEAESLAGKGSFNPETTRVIHIQETPLAQSLKEEVKVLRRQLEVANNSSSSASSKQVAIHDPDKLNQRLKENFKEQIALFREGVYLMTGFKVDMLPGTDRPTFRVRSMYAEREEDHLMLKWPKTEHVQALDILHTDLAKNLMKSQNYEYMTKFHSLPAFLASSQLSWFEKQTVM